MLVDELLRMYLFNDHHSDRFTEKGIKKLIDIRSRIFKEIFGIEVYPKNKKAEIEKEYQKYLERMGKAIDSPQTTNQQ